MLLYHVVREQKNSVNHTDKQISFVHKLEELVQWLVICTYFQRQTTRLCTLQDIFICYAPEVFCYCACVYKGVWMCFVWEAEEPRGCRQMAGLKCSSRHMHNAPRETGFGMSTRLTSSHIFFLLSFHPQGTGLSTWPQGELHTLALTLTHTHFKRSVFVRNTEQIRFCGVCHRYSTCCTPSKRGRWGRHDTRVIETMKTKDERL